MSWDNRWFSEERRRRHVIEANAVFIIILLTIGLVLAVYHQQHKNALRSVCAQQLKRVMMAMEMYSQDYDGNYPPTDIWVHSLLTYIDKPSYFYCPSHYKITKRNKQSQRKGIEANVSYWYIQPLLAADEPSRIPVTGDHMFMNYIGNHNDGGNVGYADGHVKWKTSEMWEKDAYPVEYIFDDNKKNNEKKKR